MSEIKPKRAAREPVRSEAIAEEAIAAATASVIERNMTPELEPVSTIALAQAAHVGPACPVPSAPESSPPDKPPEVPAETAWTAFAEAQCALARGFEKAAVEVTGISRSGMAATADAAVALLGARTFAEAIEINAGLARRRVDAVLETSARLSEIGATAITDAYRPFLSRFAWNRSTLGSG
jgi:Phasin protein